jgi:hypothetical protein
MSKKRPKPNKTESLMVSALDRLAAFEEFQEEILPTLRGALKEGKTAEDIYKLVQAHAAARTATIALTERDPAKALSAIKDILDRSGGKPTERREVEHKYSKLKDEELDSLILSEISDVTEDDLAN